MDSIRSVLVLFFLLSSAALITACGGGGGSSGVPVGAGGFKTAGQTISPQHDGSDHRELSIAYDSSGNALAVWQKRNGIDYRLMYSFFNGTAWSAEKAVGRAYSPSVVSNGTDFLVIYTLSGTVVRFFDPVTETMSAEEKLTTTYGYGHVAVSNGTGYAMAWSQSSSVFAAVYNGLAWEAAAEIESSADTTYYPSIATDGTGYAVAWQQYISAVYEIYVNMYEGGAWGTPVPIESQAGSGTDASVASDGLGYAVAWKQGLDIYANIYNGTAWETEEAIESLPRSGFSPAIASNGSGYAVVWQHHNGSYYDIYANMYNGNSWGIEENIESALTDSNSPAIISSGAGYAALWLRDDGTGLDNVMASIHEGGTWGPDDGVDSVAGTVYGLSAVPRGTGYAVAWEASSGGPIMPFHNSYSSGSWGAVEGFLQKSHPGSVYFSHHLATNEDGVTMAVWNQYDGNDLWSVYTRMNSNGSWGTPFKVGTGQYSDVETDGSTFMVVWPDSLSIKARLYNGAAWEDAVIVNSSTGGANYGGMLATDGSGYMLLWTKKKIGSLYYDLYASAYNGTSWEDGVSIESGTGNIDEYHAASNGSGYAATWRLINTSSIGEIYAAIYNGSDWEAEIELDKVAYTAYSPQIASDGTDYAVIWNEYNGLISDVYSSMYNGTAWEYPLNVDGSAEHAEYATIASNGVSYAASWQEKNTADNDFDINASMFNGTGWEQSENVDRLLNDAYYPSMTSDGTSYAIVWQHRNGPAYSDIVTSIYNGTGWDSTAMIDSMSDSSSNPDICASKEGYSAIWKESDIKDPLDIYNKVGAAIGF